MLVKELLNVRFVGDKVLPSFVSVRDEILLSLADRMISVYDAESGITRGEIEEMLMPIVSTCRNLRLANGMKKVLDDRAEYSGVSSEDQAAMRRNVFLSSADVLRSGQFADEASYRGKVMSSVASAPKALYSDLPENEKLVSVGKMTPRELLERYNCALVQGLLLYADRLELEFSEARPSQLRRLMRAVKFFRLVADVVCKDKNKHTLDDEPMTIRMIVDGPGSVLANSRSYGMQLASFFPHVCQMEHWKLKAKVKLREKVRNLSLDESCSLVYNGRMTAAYVPEEIELFSQRIKQKLDGTSWHLDDEAPYIKCKGGMLIFPDYAFMDDTGNFRYLELFHRWHATQLVARLDALDKGADWPLIIGVDNAIASREDIAELLASSLYFQKNGFTYRDYPVPDKVLNQLTINN